MADDESDLTVEESDVAEPTGPKLTTPYWPGELPVDDTTAVEQNIITVTCDTCGHDAEIMDHPVEGHEQRWQCNCSATRRPEGDGFVSTKPDGDADCLCEALNIIEGEPGVPGEGALNPAAAGVTDAELIEAAVRRGILPEESLSDEHRQLLSMYRDTAPTGPRGTIHSLQVGGGVGPTGTTTGSKV